jgi:HK97 gp10 family phage protein
VKVIGTEKALQKLAEARRKADLKRLRLILVEAMRPVFAAIKTRAPYDPTPDDDPHIRDLIKRRSSVGRQRRSNRVASVEIGIFRNSFANIARFQEFGTVRHDAQPFMVNTLDEHADAVFDHIRGRMKAELDQ